MSCAPHCTVCLLLSHNVQLHMGARCSADLRCSMGALAVFLLSCICVPCANMCVPLVLPQFVTNNTIHVFIGGVDEKLVANKAITQHVKVRQHLSLSPSLPSVSRG